MRVVFVLLLAIAFPAESGWKQACVHYLQTLHQEAETEKYGRIIGYSLRAILKDHKPEEIPPELVGIPERRGLGFLFLYLPPEKPNRWIAWLTPTLQYPVHLVTRAAFGQAYSLSPTGPLSYYVIRPAVHGATKAVFGKTKEFTLGMNILIGGVIAATLYDKLVDAPFREAVANSIVEEIPKHGEAWKFLEESDFRYAEVAEAERSGAVSERDAQVLAFIRNRYWAIYYSFMRDEYEALPSEKAREHFLEFPAFYPIRAFVEEGIPKHPYYSYAPDFEAKLSPQQTDGLIQVTVWKLALEEGVAKWFQKGMPEVAGELTAEERVMREFLNSPYAKAVLAFHRRGKIPAEKVLRALQEDIHWQGQFRSWTVLRLVRLKVVDGEPTSEVLTLKEIRLETLHDLGKQSRSANAFP